MVELAFVEKLWQDWAVYVAVLLIKLFHVSECVEIAKEGKEDLK